MSRYFLSPYSVYCMYFTGKKADMKKREEEVYRERIGDGKENSEPPKKKKKAEKTGRKRLFLGKRKKKEEEIQKSQRRRNVSFIPHTLYLLIFAQLPMQ